MLGPAMSDKKTYSSFEEFWPDYVRAHSNPTNRKLHFIGSSLGLACAAGGLIFRKKRLLLLAPVVGYGFAWVGHFVYEKNVPASFSNPIHSFRADWKMWKMILDGTMDAEVEKHVTADAPVQDESANGAHRDATAN